MQLLGRFLRFTLSTHLDKTRQVHLSILRDAQGIKVGRLGAPRRSRSEGRVYENSISKAGFVLSQSRPLGTE